MHGQFQEICETICAIGRRLYRFGHVVANDGNISARVRDDLIVTTPTGVCKGDMLSGQMVFVSPEGRIISGGRPSTELPMHLFIYRHRPEIHAVVHAHPVYATAFATAGIALDRCVLAEIITTIGSIPVAPYGTPSTEELPASLQPYVQDHEAILLANHGAVTMGRTLWEAYYKLERVEHFARIIFLSRQLGGERTLPREEVEKLFALREQYGIEAVNPGCKVEAEACGYEHSEGGLSENEIERLSELVYGEVKALIARGG